MKHTLSITTILTISAMLALSQVAVSQSEGVVSSVLNPLQIALKRWYAVNSTTTVAVGSDRPVSDLMAPISGLRTS